MSHHYDPSPKPCKCGTGCGLLIERTTETRNRRYHVDCTSTDAKRKERAARYQRAYYARERAKKGPPKPPTPPKVGKHCSQCCGIGERRPYPPEVCIGCGFSFQAEVFRR